MNTPKVTAVMISDVHYSLKTLDLADKSMRVAIDNAASLRVPLIVAGDIHDSKSIIRGECANAMIRTVEYAESKGIKVYVLVGNHCKLSEKSQDHSLHFLKPYCTVIDTVSYIVEIDAIAIPYQHDLEELRSILSGIHSDHKTLIMHQGILGAHLGEYVLDKSSISPKELARFRVILGHYHRHQTIGTATYIGTPYTITFAEANDGPKGIQLLKSDGTLEQIQLHLRKHVIVERDIEDVMQPIEGLNRDDILWLKVSGSTVELDKLSKSAIGKHHLGHSNYKLDKIPTDVQGKVRELEKMTPDQMLDALIEESDEKVDQKSYLKTLWREILV